MKRNCAVSLFGSSLGLGLLFILLTTATVQAAGVVTNCTGQGLAGAMNSGSGLITFACGAAPVAITVTQAGGFNVIPGRLYTIDGGNAVTLTGAGANRLFDIQAANAALTLTNIILTDGNASALGHFPTQGGAILNEGGRLALDHVTIGHSKSYYSGGAIEDVNGTTVLMNSLIENNESQYGGGIDSSGALTLINTIVRDNHATVHDGGGLDVGGTVVISDSQIVSNTAKGSGNMGGGGGINIVASADVSISGSRLNANQTPTTTLAIYVLGGGALRNFGQLYISQSTLNGNSSFSGGGLYNGNAGYAALSNVTFGGNSGFEGGAISNGRGSTLNMYQVTLSGNSAPFVGGGLLNRATAYVNNSTLSDNSSNVGGGLINYGVATVTNCTLSSNSAKFRGGGVYNVELADLKLVNVTLSDNSAQFGGGGIYMNSAYTTTLTNTILAYSPAGGNCGGTVTAAKFSLSSDNSCTLGGMVNGHSADGLDPLLTALGDYGGPTLVHMLKVGSPAIAGVLGNDAPVADQRGRPRPGSDGNYDIGAVERQPDDASGAQSQTITFGALNDRTLGDPPFALNATASSGLAVSFTSQTPATCTVSDTTVTLMAVGTCTIRASQAGDAAFQPAPNVEQAFAVRSPNKQNQTMTFAALAKRALGEPAFPLTASATSGLPVRFTSLTSKICTVAGNVVTLVDVGACSISATQDGDATFNPTTPVVRTFAVSGPNKQYPIYLPAVEK